MSAKIISETQMNCTYNYTSQDAGLSSPFASKSTRNSYSSFDNSRSSTATTEQIQLPTIDELEADDIARAIRSSLHDNHNVNQASSVQSKVGFH